MASQGTRLPERGARLFLGNLSYDATESHISQAVQGCGGVLYVGVRRPDTQNSRGHGQVEFSSEDDELRALERLQGFDVKGRNIRVDWCDQPHRRKYLVTAGQVGASGGPQREGIAQGGLSTVELFDSEGCLTAAALSAADGVTLGDLEQILDELSLLLTSTGSLLQQLLQQDPLLRAALLQAQLLLGKHDQRDLSNISTTSLKRAEMAATQRLLLECRALRPPALSALTVNPPTQASLKPSTSASRQKKQEVARPAAGWRPAATQRVPPSTDTLTTVSATPRGASWLASPAPDTQVGVGPSPNFSPVTPEPSAPAHGDRVEGNGDLGRLHCAFSHKRKEGEGPQHAIVTPEGTSGDNKRARLASSAAVSTICHSGWLAAEEAKATMAPDYLVDELLRSQGLLEKVTRMAPAELMQLDQQQRLQVFSLRKALRARGKLPAIQEPSCAPGNV